MSFITQQGRALLLTAVLVAVGAVCTSNGADRPSALVGHWICNEDESNLYMGSLVRIELYSDGTGVVGVYGDRSSGISVTWKVENKRLVFLSAITGFTFNYEVSGYALTLVDNDGNIAIFVKKGMEEKYKKKKEEEAEERWLKDKERLKKEAEQITKKPEPRIEKISRYFTDPRDGQKYRAVKIGGKPWMAQNLNYQTGSSWFYDNQNSNCEIYGRLYDWNTAKTACPSGWHLPSREEWNDLVAVAGGKNVAGKALKSTYGWVMNKNGTDDYGFSALPGGARFDENFNDGSISGWWWTATEYSAGFAYQMHVLSVSDYLSCEGFNHKSYGFSVRCVKDD
jgi:uncharacterized protein (TIGR02145 family)